MIKPVTAYTKTSKNSTAYSVNSSIASLLLNSTTVRLNSTAYKLSGYTGATPNQINNKPSTSYT